MSDRSSQFLVTAPVRSTGWMPARTSQIRMVLHKQFFLPNLTAPPALPRNCSISVHCEPAAPPGLHSQSPSSGGPEGGERGLGSCLYVRERLLVERVC